ncbi:hypothetical protein OGCDGJMD_01227 [Cyanobium usitatum str. Tous]|uniref:hypothetical protein n=1 Tax=Cyanobium usitatum TaxID=2304190 RepID=UPI002AD4677A|nr:hypothetical protein [Cyanobium usitatum]CAK6692413.1 hypothetical protein OGCDGJMD_01227 [Cyanobium usitatum str. Tous]
MTAPTALWMACPAPDGEHWLPWDLYQITPPDDAMTERDAAWWRREAHRWARQDRKAWPGHLIAVRAANDGPPVWPEAMADHYDLPPYSDQ